MTGEPAGPCGRPRLRERAFWGSGKVELLSDETLACTPEEAGKTGRGEEEIAASLPLTGV